MGATYGLIGKKLSHSFSKKYFTQKFEKEGIKASYELFELERIEEFPQLIQNQPQLHGLNVTIPYKEEIIPYLDEVLPEARAIGAVNTIKRSSKGLIGFNSDLYGFLADLEDMMGELPSPRAALILGTGGAARAVHFALSQRLDISGCCFVSRRGGRSFLGSPVISYSEVDQKPSTFWELVINTTPLGMFPDVNSVPELPYEKFALPQQSLAYDLVYNPEKTRFMELAQQNGARVRNGRGMLIGQAEKSWQFWQADTGIKSG